MKNCIHRFVLACACGIMLVACSPAAVTENTPGEVAWPEITQQNKPWSRWWWEGSAVRKSDLTAAMEAYRDANLGGMEITPIYGVHGYEDRFLNFLSPEWMDAFMFTLREGTRLDLGIDLANASGWPFGGPWVDSTYACKYMAHVTYNLKEGEKLQQPIRYMQRPVIRYAGPVRTDIRLLKKPVASNDDLQTMALDQVRFEEELPIIAVIAYNAANESVILTDKVDANGMLDWTAPAGDWTVYALFQGLHGKLVERAGPGGEGDVIDHFAVEPTKKYLSRFDEAFKGYDISSLRYYFNDSYEVDDANGTSDWTPDLFREFQTRRGYDLKRYLPALFGYSADQETNMRVLYDYRRTISDLLRDGYTRTWHNWAAAQGKGIRNQAHGSPANILDLYGASDVPETEGREIIISKTASSVSHVMGKPLTSSESATWLGEHFESKLSEVKTCIDGFLLAGVNHVFYHGTCFSPQDAQWPGWLFYAAVHFTPTNSFWTDFGDLNMYIARCQSFLQAGKPDNDILLYYNISDVWSGGSRTMLPHFKGLDTNFDRNVVNMAQRMMDQGFAWDFISDLQLQDVAVKNGELTTGGTSYKTLVLPECRYIPLETMEKIMALAKKGATVIVHNALPGDVTGFKDFANARAKLQNMSGRLEFTATGEGDVQEAACGKGRILLGSDPAAMLAYAGVRRESMYDKGLQCIRRQDGDKTYYFIANRTSQPVSGWIPVATEAPAYAIYEPMTGKAGLLPVRTTGQQTSVLLQLEADASCIVEACQSGLNGEPYQYFKTDGYPITIDTPWQLTFVKGGPVLPESMTVSQLADWTTYEDQTYKDFSGTASYTTTLPDLNSNAAACFVLDLGDLNESASVYINGKHLQTLFSQPFRVTIDKAMLTGNDTLRVDISNSMGNRIAYNDRNGIEWKIFYNTNINPRKGENNRNGSFSAAHWAPRPSGLFGPVTLTAVTPVSAEE